MRVYMAGGISMRQEILKRSYELESVGIEVTARWLFEGGNANLAFGKGTDERKQAHAIRDISDIERADWIVYNSNPDPEYRSRGAGAQFELGYGYARDKHILIVGIPRNVFHFLPHGDAGIIRTPDWKAGISLLRSVNGDVLDQAEPDVATAEVKGPGHWSKYDKSIPAWVCGPGHILNPEKWCVPVSSIEIRGKPNFDRYPRYGYPIKGLENPSPVLPPEVEFSDRVKECEEREARMRKDDPYGWAYSNHAMATDCTQVVKRQMESEAERASQADAK